MDAAIGAGAVRPHLELTEAAGLGDRLELALHEDLVPHAPADEVGHGHDADLVLGAEAQQVGSRAIVPSSFMISQMTPEGFRPARRARSTEPSVWPVRTSTPPSRARSGKTWPGVTRSCADLEGSMATRMVWARSAAEIPVLTPSRASMETVKAVP